MWYHDHANGENPMKAHSLKSRRLVPFNTGTRVMTSKRDKARSRAVLNRQVKLEY